MNLKTFLAEKLEEADLQTLIGDENLKKLEQIGLDENNVNLLKGKLLSLTEAENSDAIFQKHKDTVYKAAQKAAFDSVDSALLDHLDLLGDEVKELGSTKEKTKALLKKYKEITTDLSVSNQTLNAKLKEGVGDAEAKALIEEKEAELKKMKETFVPKQEILEAKAELENLKATYVPKEQVEVFSTENRQLKKEIENANKITIQDKITTSALNSKLLKDDISSSPLVASIANAAVHSYLEENLFGLDKVKVELVLNKETRQLDVRQSKNLEMPIAVDGKILKLEDIIDGAIRYSKLDKKSEQGNNSKFKSDGSNSFPKSAIKIGQGMFT